MNFTEVVNQVVLATKRPDKIEAIRREVNAALNFCCIETNFARDREEILVPVDSTAYIHSILLSNFPLWRKFDYIKAPASKHYVLERSPSKVFEKDREAKDVYYIAGSSVKISLCMPTPSLIVGYYMYPPLLTDANPNFWLLEVSPYMIIAKAAAAIFSEVGNTVEAATQTSVFARAFISVQRDYKTGANYG